MANSRFEYVRHFEQEDRLLRNCWIVIRIDGRSFSQFVNQHNYVKPNDIRGIQLMNECAKEVFKSISDCVFAYGHSDEYSFVLPKSSNIFKRRSSKLLSVSVSCFSAAFVLYWSNYFPDQSLDLLPMFDGRIICYPSDQNLRDYLSWRQADCHINNMYNICFWKLVNECNMTGDEAEEYLKGTVSSDKNELLFTKFGINYNEIEPIYRKGTCIFYTAPPLNSKNPKPKRILQETFDDIISSPFWEKNHHLLI